MRLFFKLSILLFFILSCFLSVSAQEESLSGGTMKIVGPLAEPRELHAATTLSDGRVLVAGGFTKMFKALSSCEVFDPIKNKFVKAASMKHSRFLHTATLLKDGRVLIVGGIGDNEAKKMLVDEAELFDPTTGTFIPTGSLNIPRQGHTATLLSDGRVLIIGGGNAVNYFKSKGISELEIYDLGKGQFQVVGKLETPRQFHTATLLNDGRVLITGGSGEGLKSALGSAEIYDPTTNTTHFVSPMNDKRVGHSAVLLPDGMVLIVGGSDYVSEPRIKSVEVFDPQTEKFTLTDSMHESRVDSKAILLDDGNVLIAGGSTKGPIFHKSAELYNFKTKKFNPVCDMAIARDTFSPAKLKDGRVLFMGGATREDNGLQRKLLTLAEVYVDKSDKGIKPELEVSYNEISAGAPLKVSLNAKVGKEVSVFWDFGDGQTGEGEKLDHIYSCPGYYNVGVTAINEKCNNMYKTLDIQVAPQKDGQISFTCAIEPLLDNRCLGCHAFLNDSLLGSYDELINSKAVIPQNSKDSKLLMVNDSKHKMMPSYVPLTSSELSLISDWINQGSKNN